MTTTCTNPQPLDFGTSDSATFKVCSFLVNVLSCMYEQWKTAGFPYPWNNWQPAYACGVPNNFDVNDYDFRELIWSTFTYTDSKGAEQTATEPFGCVVQSKADGSFYLVFRGSKSDADFSVDDQTELINYDAPTPLPPPGIQVEQGWWAVYSGLFEGLRVQLKEIRGNKLIITGHSLGSALATLAVPDASANFLPEVRLYNSASPMVGNDAFCAYYESLKGRSPGTLKEAYRLVNRADTVPNFPNVPGYVHVGTAVYFNADYGEKLIPHQEKKAHDPCCSYAYAIYNPDNPCNSAYDLCAAPR